MEAENTFEIQADVSRFFTPNTPIDESRLFSGRISQIERIVEAVGRKGQHAIVFGERGVGKTSFANVVGDFLEDDSGALLCLRATADSSDTFSSIWRKIFSDLSFTHAKNKIGFDDSQELFQESLCDRLPEKIDSATVQNILKQLGQSRTLVVIIDEFDRLSREVSNLIADVIKVSSDQRIDTTIVVVGVADAVEHLIEQHASVERVLIQIPMPRMSSEEVVQILVKGLNHMSMKIEDDALMRIVLLAQGLPHYAHLLGLYSAVGARKEGLSEVAVVHVEKAVEQAVNNAQHSIKSAYTKACSSPRADSLYEQVLLACALSQVDDLGYFQPAAVKGPMSKIMERSYDVPSFARHLNQFTEEERGPVLERTGSQRRYRYRFRNPLMQPYVIMRGLSDGRFTGKDVGSLVRGAL